jgi:hypothetical protein
LAKVLNRSGNLGDIFLTIHLGAEFPGLLLQAGISGIQFLAATLIFRQRQDFGEVRFSETLHLLAKRSLGFPQCLSAGLQLLRKPISIVGTSQSVDNRFRPGSGSKLVLSW